MSSVDKGLCWCGEECFEIPAGSCWCEEIKQLQKRIEEFEGENEKLRNIKIIQEGNSVRLEIGGEDE